MKIAFRLRGSKLIFVTVYMRCTIRLLILLLCIPLLGSAPPKDVDVADTLRGVMRGEVEAKVVARVRHLKTDAAVPVLTVLLRDRDGRVRRAAAHALVYFKSDASLDPLVASLSDTVHSVVLRSARTLLTLHGADAADSVATQLAHASIAVRCGIAADGLRRPME